MEEKTDEEKSEVFANKSNNSFRVSVSKNLKDKKLVSIKSGRFEISWKLEKIAIDNKEIKANNSVALYRNNKEGTQNSSENEKKMILKNLYSGINFENAYPNIDLQYMIEPESLKENIILKERQSNPEISFIINSNNLELKLSDDNSVVISENFNTENKNIFKMDPPFMTDAKGKHSNAVSVKLEEIEGGYRLILIPNNKWLSDNEVTYPVTIDPTI